MKSYKPRGISEIISLNHFAVRKKNIRHTAGRQQQPGVYDLARTHTHMDMSQKVHRKHQPTFFRYGCCSVAISQTCSSPLPNNKTVLSSADRLLHRVQFPTHIHTFIHRAPTHLGVTGVAISQLSEAQANGAMTECGENKEAATSLLLF